MKLKILQMVILLAVLATTQGEVVAQSPEDILIIVNSSQKVDSVDVSEVRDYFLKKRTHWTHGAKVVPINAPAGSKLRKDFEKRVLDIGAEDLQLYWQQEKIKKGTKEPVSFSNPLKAVFKLRNAISYVYRSQYKEGVAKIIAVVPG